MNFIEWPWISDPGRECGREIGVLRLVVQSFSRFRHYVDGTADRFGDKTCRAFADAFEEATTPSYCAPSIGLVKTPATPLKMLVPALENPLTTPSPIFFGLFLLLS